MDKILVVSSSEKGKNVYIDNLKSMGYVHIDSEGNGGAARRRLLNEQYNLVLIDTPLKDEFGTSLAIKVVSSSDSGVVVFVKSENADMISAKVEEHGVFVIPKPFTKSIFHQGVKFVFTSIKRYSALNEKQGKLLKKVEDIKIIDRAKCLLIQYKKMTEEEAHKYIEKHAMESRITRRELADKLIEHLE